MKENYFRDLLTEDIKESDVILLGIPYDLGCSCGKGASDAPKVIRELSSFLPPFTADGKTLKNVKIYDYNDVEEYSKIEEKFTEILNYDKFNLVLGGDHSVSIPTQKAFLDYCRGINKIPVIIHIDAHPDICDFYDGSKYSHACTNMRAIENGYDTKDITLVGIRGYEEQEVIYLANHKELEVYNASYLNKFGFEEVLKSLFNKYKYSKEHLIYLSYDIDANDPSFAPGTGTPEAFGLNSIELLDFIKELYINLPIKVMDIVEVSPVLDTNNITSWLALKTVYEILGLISEKK